MSLVKTIGSLKRVLYLLLVTLVFVIYMTLKGGTSGACAACKYQRRRCAADCPLAPYFPADQPKIFQNVHKLFGVRSIVKILETLDEAHRPEAMKSIIFQSNVRERSPVHGCLGVAHQLQYMVWQAEEELKAVNTQLEFFRSQRKNNNHNPNSNHLNINEIGEKSENVATSQLDLGMGLPVNNNPSNVAPFFSPLPVSEMHQQPSHQQEQPHYAYCNEVSNNGFSYKDSEILANNNPDSYVDWGQNRFSYENNDNVFSDQNEMKSTNNNGVRTAIESSALVSFEAETNHLQEEEDDIHKYDEVHEFLELVERHSKQAFASSSSGESLKGPIDESGDKELKSATNYFSLS
ncbi:unnamed protein product [Cochlearia groenlandica]